ncbi:hypothetical protein PUN28_004190 [Cardiocondyla obscurior]|uniref:Uncharacterized protein n=1 Tax=Cardiocondyla obscurior TaxID=286306 RepID=A0AAW2GPY3_9HYME
MGSSVIWTQHRNLSCPSDNRIPEARVIANSFCSFHFPIFISSHVIELVSIIIAAIQKNIHNNFFTFKKKRIVLRYSSSRSTTWSCDPRDFVLFLIADESCDLRSIPWGSVPRFAVLRNVNCCWIHVALVPSARVRRFFFFPQKNYFYMLSNCVCVCVYAAYCNIVYFVLFYKCSIPVNIRIQ